MPFTVTARKPTARGCALCGAGFWLTLQFPLCALADGSAEAGSGPTGNQAAILVPATIDCCPGTVASISIDNGNVFDLTHEGEDGWLYRLANRAHVTTRPEIIAQQLLFDEGERITRQSLEETERILRSNRYIQEASVQATQREDGSVDVAVQTSDAWTLVPKISLSRSGGENSGGLGIKEMNLLGKGIEVEASYRSNVDRDEMILRYLDRHLFDSWYSLAAVHANNSDGFEHRIDLAKPFYSLDSTSAHGVSFSDSDRVDSFYDSGEIDSQFRHQARSAEVFQGWSKGLRGRWARRYETGLAYDEHLFSPAGTDFMAPPTELPGDRTLLYPFVGIEIVEDEYTTTKNLDQVNVTEDRYMGTRVSARVGYASADFGSDRDAWIINAAASSGFGDIEGSSLVLSSQLAARVEDEGVRNLTAGVSAGYYWRQSDHRLLYVGMSGIYGRELDADNQLLLGGDTGLRGYPLRYLTGEKTALFTLEQRVFTDWYPFRLFRVGGAVFFDAGKSWDSRVDGTDSEWLRDVGFGLRLGNTRSGQGRMTHIDLAFPLDGGDSISDVQLVIATKKSF